MDYWTTYERLLKIKNSADLSSIRNSQEQILQIQKREEERIQKAKTKERINEASEEILNKSKKNLEGFVSRIKKGDCIVFSYLDRGSYIRDQQKDGHVSLRNEKMADVQKKLLFDDRWYDLAAGGQLKLHSFSIASIRTANETIGQNNIIIVPDEDGMAVVVTKEWVKYLNDETACFTNPEKIISGAYPCTHLMALCKEEIDIVLNKINEIEVELPAYIVLKQEPSSAFLILNDLVDKFLIPLIQDFKFDYKKYKKYFNEEWPNFLSAHGIESSALCDISFNTFLGVSLDSKAEMTKAISENTILSSWSGYKTLSFKDKDENITIASMLNLLICLLDAYAMADESWGSSLFDEATSCHFMKINLSSEIAKLSGLRWINEKFGSNLGAHSKYIVDSDAYLLASCFADGPFRKALNYSNLPLDHIVDQETGQVEPAKIVEQIEGVVGKKFNRLTMMGAAQNLIQETYQNLFGKPLN